MMLLSLQDFLTQFLRERVDAGTFDYLVDCNSSFNDYSFIVSGLLVTNIISAAISSVILGLVNATIQATIIPFNPTANLANFWLIFICHQCYCNFTCCETDTRFCCGGIFPNFNWFNCFNFNYKQITMLVGKRR